MGTMSPIKNRKKIEAMKKYFLGRNEIRNYALFCVGINTALRISDILNLKWGDVYDFDRRRFKKHIELTEKKTHKKNMIFLNKGALCALEKLMKHYKLETVKISAEHYIFLGRKSVNKPLSRSQAYRIIKEAAQILKIEGNIGCHSLRKTFGYFAALCKISSILIMNIYNHSSFAITKRYLGIDQDERDKVFMKVAL